MHVADAQAIQVDRSSVMDRRSMRRPAPPYSSAWLRDPQQRAACVIGNQQSRFHRILHLHRATPPSGLDPSTVSSSLLHAQGSHCPDRRDRLLRLGLYAGGRTRFYALRIRSELWIQLLLAHDRRHNEQYRQCAPQSFPAPPALPGGRSRPDGIGKG